MIHWPMVRRVICHVGKALYVSNHVQDKGLVDEQIDGTFYHPELQLVQVEQDKVYTVERILKKRKRGKKIEYL